MRATSPDGRTWRVTRRWVPWRRRGLDGVPGPSFDLLDGADDPAGIVIALIVGLVVLPIAAALFLIGGELVLLGLLLPVAVIGRIAFGRAWHVEVRRGFTPWTEIEAGDWAASTQTISHLVGRIEAGQIPVRTLGSDPEPAQKGRDGTS